MVTDARFVARQKWLQIARYLYLRLVLFPKALFSRDFWSQVSLARKHYPVARLRFRPLFIRSWGQEASISITEVFKVPVSELGIKQLHPEIEAVLQGGEVLDLFRTESLAHGYDPEKLEERLEKTRQLLRTDYDNLFSEARVSADGGLSIHDGYHRAGLGFLTPSKTANILITYPIDLR